VKGKVVKGNILAEGEATGHHHKVTVQVMEREDGMRSFDGATTVTHEEHKPITLPNKKWTSGQKREMDWVSKMERQVID